MLGGNPAFLLWGVRLWSCRRCSGAPAAGVSATGRADDGLLSLREGIWCATREGRLSPLMDSELSSAKSKEDEDDHDEAFYAFMFYQKSFTNPSSGPWKSCDDLDPCMS